MKKKNDTLSSSSCSSAAADAPERSDVDGIRNELFAAGWTFMLKRQHSRQSKARNVVFLCDGLLTNWTNVTGDTCKTQAEKDAL